MIALRFLVIAAALAGAACAIGFLLTGERRYLAWAVRVLKVTGVVALVFFAILFAEKLQLP